MLLVRLGLPQRPRAPAAPAAAAAPVEALGTTPGAAHAAAAASMQRATGCSTSTAAVQRSTCLPGLTLTAELAAAAADASAGDVTTTTAAGDAASGRFPCGWHLQFWPVLGRII